MVPFASNAGFQHCDSFAPFGTFSACAGLSSVDNLLSTNAQFDLSAFAFTNESAFLLNNQVSPTDSFESRFDLDADDISQLLGESGPNSPSTDPVSDLFDSNLDIPILSDDMLTIFTDEQSSYPNSPIGSPVAVVEEPVVEKVKRVSKSGITKKSKGRTPKRVQAGAANKRDSHNISERHRRSELKQSFEALRSEIPDISSLHRVHTGGILKHAIDYIRQLEREEAESRRHVEMARAENDRLKIRLGVFN